MALQKLTVHQKKPVKKMTSDPNQLVSESREIHTINPAKRKHLVADLFKDNNIPTIEESRPSIRDITRNPLSFATVNKSRSVRTFDVKQAMTHDELNNFNL